MTQTLLQLLTETDVITRIFPVFSGILCIQLLGLCLYIFYGYVYELNENNENKIEKVEDLEDPEKILSETLYSFSNYTLSSFAGRKGSKTELINTIMEPIRQNIKKHKG